MEDLISVIVPVYNVEKYLDRCIESIVSQTYKNFEILLIDDGSTDSSAEICNIWKEKDKRIKVFSKKNKGASSARNYGICNMKGKYVVFIDSDDYIEENYLENLLVNLKKENYDIVISNAIIKINNKFKKFNSINNNYVMNNKEALNKLFLGRDFQSTPWGKMYKSEIVKKISFNEKMNIAEDMEFLIRYLEYSNKAILIAYYGYYYEIRKNSLVRALNNSYYEELNFCNELIEKFKNTEFEKSAIMHYVNINMNYAFSNFLNKSELNNIKINIRKYKKYFGIRSDATKNEKIKYFIIQNLYLVYKFLKMGGKK